MATLDGNVETLSLEGKKSAVTNENDVKGAET